MKCHHSRLVTSLPKGTMWWAQGCGIRASIHYLRELCCDGCIFLKSLPLSLWILRSPLHSLQHPAAGMPELAWGALDNSAVSKNPFQAPSSVIRLLRSVLKKFSVRSSMNFSTMRRSTFLMSSKISFQSIGFWQVFSYCFPGVQARNLPAATFGCVPAVLSCVVPVTSCTSETHQTQALGL